MHLLVRETRSLDEQAAAVDLAHAPAPLLVLSFSDADLAAFPSHPDLRTAPLARLRHPLSVDLYLERTAAYAKCVVLRLLGGLDYWRYGAEELAALCRDRAIPLAILPGDGRDDPALQSLSTISPTAYRQLDACFRHGGRANMAYALAAMAHLAGLSAHEAPPARPMPQHAVHTLDLDTRPLAAIVFYRSHLLSEDIAPVCALTAALQARGLAVGAIYAGSLKTPETAAFIARTLAAWQPAVVLNATGFSARVGDASPLDAANTPVLQLILAGTGRGAWQASTRGLTPADLAMQVALPELDGRLLTTAISFKAEQDGRTIHVPDEGGIALTADRAAAWANLRTSRSIQAAPLAMALQDVRGRATGTLKVAIVLSDYPAAGGRQGHAVGLDAFASLAAIADLLGLPKITAAEATHALCHASAKPFLSLAAYQALFATLPDTLRAAALATWGDPADAAPTGHFTIRQLHLGPVTASIQPNRGGDRKTSYHDPDLPPSHPFIAFYLHASSTADAMVHLGTHGSLEWLPGKAAALSPTCWPQALIGGLPVIYPFIVNNPGEAAAAKRRLGAVTIGHLTPPLRPAGNDGEAAVLEQMIDEYAAADGMDCQRTALLRTDILDRAATAGLLAESGVAPGTDDDDALARLDAYLCDVKELQIRDGLHIFGVQPDPERLAMLPHGAEACAAAERHGLLDALAGRFVPPGPAGAPSSGRTDVLPTGRNLAGIDPRSLPTRSAMTLAGRAAADFLDRYRQDHGDWPRSLVLNVWGASAMRTGGADLALALLLLGVRPVWDDASARVNGFTIMPIAELDRPRVDVTLRISGLFRDAFAAQVTLFDAASAAVAARDEAPDWNPLAGQPGPRVFGPAPGAYGVGDDWLATSAHCPDGIADPAALTTRVRAADAFLHVQDHAETDLLDSPEYAAHFGGFAAAATALGASPALYHSDGRVRPLPDQIARVVRGRAANPAWLAGMMRHGYAGAAEMALSVDSLAAFASTLRTRFDRQFDLLHDALTTPVVDAFLHRENPDAHAAIAGQFAAMREANLWHPRRNIP